MDRPAALELLHEYTQSESLRKHAYAVEAAMVGYARRFGEDERLWGLTGLLHDFDYERWPDPEHHPTIGVAILRERDCPEPMLQAILGHAEYLNVPRETRLAKALFAVDELCGFTTAVALVRPSKSIHEVEVRSVRKKMKDRAFAAAVKREDIIQGAEELGVDLDQHVANVIESLRQAAPALGLDGVQISPPGHDRQA